MAGPPSTGEIDPVASIRCTRCGGRVTARQSAQARNPFMPRRPILVVCADCGLDFEVRPPEEPASGEPPW